MTLSIPGPGSEKEAYITRKSLKHLSFSVQLGGAFNWSTRKYNYFQMAQLAKDPDLDWENKKTMLYVGGFLDSPSFLFASSMGKVYKALGYNVLMLDTNWFTTVEYPRLVFSSFYLFLFKGSRAPLIYT